ncbi:recombination protein NinB [Novosphingobium sp. BL-8A]|uniref:recombination protein NinB n=1 Tax=Novosphingobium sp. BL-8A TaxID=3127639 RepID=UPI003757CCA2
MANGQTLILANDQVRRLAHQLIDRAPERAVLNIREATRSLDQNAKMHAMLSDISRAKPMGRNLKPEIWKCLFLDAMGHQANWVPSLDGDGVVNTGFRSSRLTVAQMSDMIESMYAFGAEHGVVWSEPAERHAA